jgi:4-hydroxybutyrate dehydrogenase/sulfolactaldehyde 3-reductase
MGSAFSHHLIKSGFEVRGFDLDEQRMRQLSERGGTPAASPAEAAQGARFMLTSLPNSDIVREVVFGKNGIAEGAKPGLILADATTARPQDSKNSAQSSPHAVSALDAAVSGTSCDGGRRT